MLSSFTKMSPTTEEIALSLVKVALDDPTLPLKAARILNSLLINEASNEKNKISINTSMANLVQEEYILHGMNKLILKQRDYWLADTKYGQPSTKALLANLGQWVIPSNSTFDVAQNTLVHILGKDGYLIKPAASFVACGISNLGPTINLEMISKIHVFLQDKENKQIAKNSLKTYVLLR